MGSFKLLCLMYNCNGMLIVENSIYFQVCKLFVSMEFGVGMSFVEFEDCMGLVEVSDTWIIVEQ